MIDHRSKSKVKDPVFATALLTSLLVIAAGSPAEARGAGKPETISWQADYIGFDPCYEEPDFAHVHLELTEKINRNNYIGRLKRTGYTDGGLVLVESNSHQLINISAGILTSHFNNIWRGDDGRMVRGRTTLVVDLVSNEAMVDQRESVCLKGASGP